MRKKLMRWLAAGMALCLTLGAAPAASAAQLPQDAPGFEKIMPYALYILDSSCTLTISGKLRLQKPGYPVIPVRPLSARYEWSSSKNPAPSPGYWWTPGPTARTGPGHLSLRRCL